MHHDPKIQRFCFARSRFGAAGLAALLLVALMANGLRAAGPAASPDGKLQADGPALLREWTPPLYPPPALKARRSGIVDVRLIVDANGRVTQARALDGSDEEFVDAALTAVKSWGFTPATDNGQAIACCLDTQVIFSPAVGQRKPSVAKIPPRGLDFSPAERTSPEPKSSPSGEYPAMLVERKIPGAVRFACTVTTDGRAVAPRIMAASHVDFVLPALAALKNWEFSPGKQGDLMLAAPIEALMTFDDLFTKAGEVLAANDITAPDGSPPSVAPLPAYLEDPVWPFERAMAGEGGEATVTFTVTETGAVREVSVRDATRPEFGAALAAAVASWGFDRPIDQDHAVAVKLMKHAVFKAIPPDAPADSGPIARLVAAMRRGEVGTARGLDEKLMPLYRVSPTYPAALKTTGAPAGQAIVEFVIDRDGRVWLPRIVSATEPAFGWSAATAITQWVFKAPHRGGELVDVKVRIPFRFAAPPH
jgi:TonB family protein